ncbi:MAG TPA: hypothetical protein VK249_08950 [Anaerolineales bacterium]|nr:hypothetical protein [Anaerolineales bacterium]
MTYDFGEVLSRAWQITWKHKVLWIIGILFAFFMSIMFPLMFSPLLFPVLAGNSRMDSMLAFLVGFIIIFSVYMLVLYPTSVLTQTSLTLGVLNAHEDNEHLSARELIKRSLPFFWRVLGLTLLFQVAMMLVVFGIQIVIFLLTILTLGVGAICAMPLTALMYPALYGAIVLMEQTMNGIVVDNMTVMDAAKQGWNLVRNNLMTIALMALVIYLGIGLIAGIAVLPIMIPFFILPLSFMEHQTNWMMLSISVLCLVLFIPLFTLINGFSTIFSKSAWVLTYLRLTRSPKAQSLLAEATP